MSEHKHCGCGHDHHEHKHCGCGHEHHHEQKHCGCGHKHHGHEHCGCGHEHHGHEHCGCGHEHHEHKHCGCGHGHHEHGDGCSCGLDHDISLESCIDDGCSCGCGCVHDHDHGHSEKGSPWIPIGIAAGLAVVGMLPFLPGFAGNLLLTAACILAGWPLFRAGLKGMIRFHLDETALLLIAAVAAIALGELREAALVVILFRLGNQLENLAIARSKKNIAALTKIRPETANLLTDGTVQEVSAKSVPVGSVILIKPGERVPLDAVIESGESSLDTAAITGESLPRETKAGDKVLSGMINRDGALQCRTVSSFSDSTASRIIQLVQESSAKKGQTEKLISKFARYYTPIIIVLALALTFLPPLLGQGPVSMWLQRALVFLVASCPCALVISIPLSFFAGIGAGSRRGILVKGSKSMEILAKLHSAVFDKTGTLTTGRLTVTEVHSLDESISEEELLHLCAVGESFSSHPMAQAVVEHYGKADPSAVSDYQEISGMGVRFSLKGKAYLCGGTRLLNANGIGTASLPEANIYLAQDGRVLGYLTVADTLRDDAKEVLSQLKKLGLRRTVMLTGDNAATAAKIRLACGADTVKADLLPHQKVEEMEKIKADGPALFVGDGMNDAPVLAMADVGVAMGLGTDAAIEAADVVLVADRLSGLVDAVKLSRRTLSIARFNIVFALGVKAVVLLLGALGHAAMWMAVFADVGVSILCVLNSTRILASKK